MRDPIALMPVIGSSPMIGDVMQHENTGETFWKIWAVRGDLIFASDYDDGSKTRVFILGMDKLYPIGTTNGFGKC
jgi:hypothetical protein